jgi:hypothetical protein
MSDLLPERLPFRVTQATGAVTRKVLDELDHLLIVVPPRAAERAWSGMPEAGKLRALLDRRGTDGDSAIVRSRLANKSATGVTLSAAPRPGENQRRVEAFALLRFAGEAIADALANRPR